ncbi:hypothetical protein LCGC14_1510140 [marine sediment metagenome]|uniref:Uncharacterized protein n=1 Tax=marine sediment metagenome TaxID=412755 RepID=A0A0F9J1P5_9ZZZZ
MTPAPQAHPLKADKPAQDKPAGKELCKADPMGPGPNYNKPHVPIRGSYDGKPRISCLYCGKWLESSK